MKKRLKFARTWLRDPEADFSTWVFADECAVEMDCSEAAGFYWGTAADKLRPEVVRPRSHSGGGKVHIWGLISMRYKSPLVRLYETVDGQRYSRLLRNHVVPFLLEALHETGEIYTFVDDNAPAHRAGVCLDVLDQAGAKTVLWPPYSPDMNPIENVWAILKQRLSKRKVKPQTEDELWAAIEEEWNALDLETIRNCVKSFERRLKNVIQVRGRWIDY